MSASPSLATPKSRIPRLQRSSSFHDVPKTISRQTPPKNEEELEALDDVGSLDSVSSVVSCMLPGQYAKAVAAAKSAFSVSKHKHSRCVANCPPAHEKEIYLTPTQRANRTIRQLKSLLAEARSDLQYKDFEIQRLTKEIVQLRIQRAEYRGEGELHVPPASLSDSGLFDDSSKESLTEAKEVDVHNWHLEKRRLIALHTEQVADLRRQHTDEVQSIRSRLTDRLEQALEQLGEANARYSSLASSYDTAREQLSKAEAELKSLRQSVVERDRLVDSLRSELEQRETHEYETHEEEVQQITQLEEKLKEHEETARKLELLQREFSNLQAAANQTENELKKENDTEDAVREVDADNDAIDIVHLKEQLQTATAKLEKIQALHDRELKDAHDSAITLKFLRSAVFYLLTDKDNQTGHLRAVQSILGFTPEEKVAVEKAMRYSYLI